jgi:pimeloyl-ACP methyl ester carboxylesterase
MPGSLPHATAREIAFTGADGNRLVATSRGEGSRSVLLLHGGGQTRHAWDGTARRLAQAGWRAVALDQRGHGDSAWVASGAYGFGDFGRDASAVAGAITTETGQKPVVVGASLGGLASLMALGTKRDEPMFGALILVDVVPQMDPTGVDHIQGFMRAKAAEGFASIDEAAEAVAGYLPHRPRPRSLDGLRKNLRRHPDGRWRWHWDPRFLDGPGSVNADWPAMEQALLSASADLRVPSLLVRGGSSELVTDEAARAFLALSPATSYVNIADARHMVAGDRNDAFGAAVLDFLADFRLQA